MYTLAKEVNHCEKNNAIHHSTQALEIPIWRDLMLRDITKFMLISFILLIGSAVVASETKPPSETVEIDETQFAFIIGGSVGGGTLTNTLM